MAKLTFRLPSKKVQYGYAELETEVPDGTTYYGIGAMYWQAVTEFWTAEAAAANAPMPDVPEETASVDAADLLKSELGATEVGTEENAKPWTVKSGEAVPPKPWEAKTEEMPAVFEDFNFS